jgi:hypothetical protein
MQLQDQHVTRVQIGPIEATADGKGVRKITWTYRDGRESSLDLFADSNPAQLAIDYGIVGAARVERETPRAERILAPYARESILPRDCDGGLVDLAAEAAPQARFQVGDKVTPISLENHCHFLQAGGVYTVAEAGYNTADCKNVIGLVGMFKLWPASQFRLADPDPLAASPLESALLEAEHQRALRESDAERAADDAMFGR